MRKTALVVIPLIALMLAGAGRSRTPRRAVQRAPTPQDTLMRLKRAVARGDRAEEWRTLSPGLKQRISRRAGRNVDVADYITFRNANRRDPQIRQAEKYLRGARVNGIRYLGGGKAWVGIRFGNFLIGKTVGVRMINHAFWSLRVRGEPQPYWGFVGDKSIEAYPAKDGSGSVTVVTRDNKGKITWQQKFEKKDVLSYGQYTKWYFDDFGQFEQQFFGGVGRQ